MSQKKKKFQFKANVQNGGHKILGKKNLENNSKKNFEQGTIHVNVVWQYPTQQQNRVQGPLQQHVTPNHKKKKKILNKFSSNIEKKFHKTAEKNARIIRSVDQNSHHCVCVAVRIKPCP